MNKPQTNTYIAKLLIEVDQHNKEYRITEEVHALNADEAYKIVKYLVEKQIYQMRIKKVLEIQLYQRVLGGQDE